MKISTYPRFIVSCTSRYLLSVDVRLSRLMSKTAAVFFWFNHHQVNPLCSALWWKSQNIQFSYTPRRVLFLNTQILDDVKGGSKICRCATQINFFFLFYWIVLSLFYLDNKCFTLKFNQNSRIFISQRNSFHTGTTVRFNF